MNTDGLLIRRFFYPVTVLGPGTRLGIWLQGCSIHCPGCMSQEMWEFDQKYFLNIDEISKNLTHYYKLGIDAVVISGGEPFDQAEGLLFLLKKLRLIGFNDILVYSGYTFQYLIDNFGLHLKYLDILISEPFKIDLETESRWYGSENQKISVLSPNTNYNSKSLHKLSKMLDPLLQIEKQNDEFFIIGIIGRSDLVCIQQIIN